MKSEKARPKTARKSGKRRSKRPAAADRARAAVVAAVLVACAIVASIVFAVAKPSRPVPESVAVVVAVPPQTVPSPEREAQPQMDDPMRSEPIAENAPAARSPQRDDSVPVRPAKPVETAKAKNPEKIDRQAEKPIDKISETLKRPAPKQPVRPMVVRSVSSRPEREPHPSPRLKGVAVMVIDDAGNNLKELDPFLRFPGPLTIAVLPGLPHSAEAARRARAAGKEVILHQPMEAVGGQNPGPGAIETGMSEEAIRAILKKNVDEVGPVVGMNNHQGSKVTADERTMKIVLAFCRERGLFFLDSRTTADSVVPAVGARTGMSIRERDVFVDNIQERAAMIRYLQEGLQKAEKKGSAVMIGHAWSSELASTLQELYPELVEQGFSLSSIARIMMGTYDDEGFGD